MPKQKIISFVFYYPTRAWSDGGGDEEGKLNGILASISFYLGIHPMMKMSNYVFYKCGHNKYVAGLIKGETAGCRFDV